MQADTDTIRGNEFDAFMQPPPAGDQTPARPASTAGTRARTLGNGSPPRPAVTAEPAHSHRKTMLAAGVLALLAVAGVGVWYSGVLAPKPLPPEVAAVVAAAGMPAANKPAAQHRVAPPPAAAPTPAPAPVPPATEVGAPIETAAPIAPASTPSTTPAASSPEAAPAIPDLAATLEARERELALLRNALANERAARARAEHNPPRGTVTAVLRDGVVVRDASGNERVVGVGQKMP